MPDIWLNKVCSCNLPQAYPRSRMTADLDCFRSPNIIFHMHKKNKTKIQKSQKIQKKKIQKKKIPKKKKKKKKIPKKKKKKNL
jgi:hypothetical protein